MAGPLSPPPLLMSWPIREELFSAASLTDPRKKIKMLKADPKKVPSQSFLFACSSRYNDLTFYKKNSHITIPLILTKYIEICPRAFNLLKNHLFLPLIWRLRGDMIND